MTGDSLQQELLEIIEPLAASLGLEIWGLEYARGKRSLLRVYVQNAPGLLPTEEDAHDAGLSEELPEEFSEDFSEGSQDPGAADADESLQSQGVSIGQCARLSRSIGLALDVEDIIPGAYTLEVSSPGVSRPFFNVGQMQPYLGQQVELILREPLVEAFPGRKSFRGPLLAAEGDTLRLDVEDGAEGDRAEVDFRWQDLKKARLAPDVAVPAAPKEKKGGKKKKKKSKKS